MADDGARTIELEVVVPGTPAAVWRAIATGPGISSWYVPHTVEEHEGGAATASFGPAPDLQVEGRVAVWDPPRRIVFDGGEGADGLAFEWHVVPGGDGTCVVRLVNGGFGAGGTGDDQYQGMLEGWQLFLTNLRLHLEHFAGRTATAALPMAMWPGPRAATWDALCRALGLPSAPEPGRRVAVRSEDAPALAGRVVDVAPWRLALLVDDPVPGTAFLAVEGQEEAEHIGVSIWLYLYGEEGAVAARRDGARWQTWLADRAAAGG